MDEKLIYAYNRIMDLQVWLEMTNFIIKVLNANIPEISQEAAHVLFRVNELETGKLKDDSN